MFTSVVLHAQLLGKGQLAFGARGIFLLETSSTFRQFDRPHFLRDPAGVLLARKHLSRPGLPDSDTFVRVILIELLL